MFDRSAITEGRSIQDFGLCDLNGVYQLTAKLRAKGWMVVTFFTPDDAFSTSVLNTLQEWTSSLPADKVSILGVLEGNRDALEAFKKSVTATFPIVWDIADYWSANWGLSELPTTFVTDSGGRVLDRIVGADTDALSDARTQLSALIEKAAAARAAADAAAASSAPSAQPAPAPAAVAAPQAVAQSNGKGDKKDPGSQKAKPAKK